MAWDAPLPFLAQPSGTDLAAFANPAAATRASQAGTGFSFGNPDSLEGPWERLWAVHHQENGQGLGFRFWEGGAASEGEFGWSAAKDDAGWLSSGARLSYRWREGAPNEVGAHIGLQARPHPAFLAGYWIENLWTSEPNQTVHRVSLGVRPLAAASGRLRELSVGYGMDFKEDERRRDAVYLQLPLPFSATGYLRWDWTEEEAGLGLSFQATGSMAAAWGWAGPRGKPSDWSWPDNREGGVRFYKQRTTPYLLGHGRIAELDLNHAIVEGEAPEGFLSPSGDIGYLEVRRRMDMIEADRRIRAVVVKLGRARTGWGVGEEIRERLLRFRAGGKKVVAYMEQATPLNYYMASAADVVAMQPGGHFAVSGFSSEVMFYRGFFEKVGVQPQFLRHGNYKSFEEPYTRKDLSPEARSNLERYMGSLWDHYLDAVAASRKLPRDSVSKALASGNPNLDHALAAGLIDTLVDQDQVDELAGGRGAAKVRLDGESVRHAEWEILPKIALVVVQGDMVMGRSNKGWFGSPELAGAQTVSAQLKRARLDPEVRAVVLRVDSPGGSAQAADIMAREVDLLRKAGKPVVASIGHMAASGGYYLICGADRIFCAHNSSVGSIGILWGKFVLKGLQDKLGLTTETVKTAPHADANSLSRPWDSVEVAMLQKHMDDFYDRFTGKVAAGRKLSREAVDSLAQGRIFTGSQAVANRLVDRIGGLSEAVMEASRLAGIPDSRLVDLDLRPAKAGLSWNSPLRAAALGGGGPLAGGWDEALAGLAERYRGLTVGQLWAVSPELAGWTAAELR